MEKYAEFYSSILKQATIKYGPHRQQSQHCLSTVHLV